MPELRTAQDFREAPTRTIAAAGAQFAYREPGPRAGVPLVLLTHLGENLDRLARDRRVITVDYSGAGGRLATRWWRWPRTWWRPPDLCSSSAATAAGWCRRRT